jgi:hypothetical protein
VASPQPSVTPMTPPTTASAIASIKNWISTSARLAPTALRSPISRVRSVTLTSMMFMMPMPPTSRLMAAIAPRKDRQRAQDVAKDRDQVVLADDAEVVLVEILDAAPLAHQLRDLLPAPVGILSASSTEA